MNRSEIAKKAWKTRKAKAAGKKAAATRKRKAAGKKAAVTRKRRAAGRKAAATKKAKAAAKKADAATAEPAKQGGHELPTELPTLPAESVRLIERHFHEVIRHRVVDEGRLRLPENLPHLDAANHDKSWFEVPGMAGGFAFEWDRSSPEPRLIVESWCRVVGGSGQRHHVTADGSRLVDEGFV